MSGDPRREQARGLMLALLLAGAGLGVAFWYGYSSHEDNALDTAGFDVSQNPEAPANPLAAAPPSVEPAQAPPPSTGLAMIKASPGLSFGSAASSAGAGAAQAGPQDLNGVARRSGGPVSEFTKRFRDRHPAMRRYSREWLSYPDLKKLNDDYLRDHDLVKFVHGLERSPNFGPLVRRIALDPESHALAKDFFSGVSKAAPAELLSAASALLKADNGAMGLAKNLFAAMGAPPMMLAALTGGSLDAGAAQGRIDAAARR